MEVASAGLVFQFRLHTWRRCLPPGSQRPTAQRLQGSKVCHACCALARLQAVHHHESCLISTAAQPARHGRIPACLWAVHHQASCLISTASRITSTPCSVRGADLSMTRLHPIIPIHGTHVRSKLPGELPHPCGMHGWWARHACRSCTTNLLRTLVTLSAACPPLSIAATCSVASPVLVLVLLAAAALVPSGCVITPWRNSQRALYMHQ